MTIWHWVTGMRGGAERRMGGTSDTNIIHTREHHTPDRSCSSKEIKSARTAITIKFLSIHCQHIKSHEAFSVKILSSIIYLLIWKVHASSRCANISELLFISEVYSARVCDTGLSACELDERVDRALTMISGHKGYNVWEETDHQPGQGWQQSHKLLSYLVCRHWPTLLHKLLLTWLLAKYLVNYNIYKCLHSEHKYGRCASDMHNVIHVGPNSFSFNFFYSISRVFWIIEFMTLHEY